MAVVQSNSIANNRPLRGPGIGGTRGGEALASVTISATQVTTDDLQLFNLPTDARVVGGWAKNDGATTIVFNVGDTGDNDRFFSAQSLAPGVAAYMTVGTGFNATFTTKTLVRAALTANATGAAVLTVCLFYICEEPV